MRTLVVGDIHGCWEEFSELLELAELAEGDQVIATGDIVDRGPASDRVWDFFQSHDSARTIMGNHEQKHINRAKGRANSSLGMELARHQLGDDYPAFLSWASELPLFIELDDAIIVHGYFEPGIPINEQKSNVLLGRKSASRYLNKNYPKPWFELYDGEKPIIVGHRNFTLSDSPFVYQDKVYGLDTNCYEGKSLTGLILPEFKVISVKAKKNWWATVKGTIDEE